MLGVGGGWGAGSDVEGGGAGSDPSVQMLVNIHEDPGAEHNAFRAVCS